MARPSGQDFPKHKGGLFGNFAKFPKSPPLCFGKSCPLGRAIVEILEILEISEISEILAILEIWEISEILEILEILEIRKVREFQNFRKVRPYVLENPVYALGRAILEILEISEILEMLEVLEIRNFGNFGNPESEGIPKFPKSPPLCFGKSCPLGRAILEILEIRKVRVKIFGNFGFCSLRLK